MEECGNFRVRKNHDGRGRQPSKFNVFGVLLKFTILYYFVLFLFYILVPVTFVTLILVKYIKIVIIHYNVYIYVYIELYRKIL